MVSSVLGSALASAICWARIDISTSFILWTHLSVDGIGSGQGRGSGVAVSVYRRRR